MEWKLGFISEKDFRSHVQATIMKYGEKLDSFDLKRFNSNLIDPVKLIFDKSVYRASWGRFSASGISPITMISAISTKIFSLISAGVKCPSQGGT